MALACAVALRTQRLTALIMAESAGSVLLLRSFVHPAFIIERGLRVLREGNGMTHFAVVLFSLGMRCVVIRHFAVLRFKHQFRGRRRRILSRASEPVRAINENRIE